MKSMLFAVPVAFVLLTGLLALPARATFHFWDIREVYTNSDGSVQFIELFTNSDGQQLTQGTRITTSTHSNTFTFPSNTPAPTGGHHLLLATPDFASLPGAVTPDFTIPTNFFSPASDTIDYVGAIGQVTFSSAPTNGVDSLNYPGATVAMNSPTNYAGEVGSLGPVGLAGDYNEDDVVNLADYTVWRDTLGSMSDLAADGDDSGTVDQADYGVWKDNFGATDGSSGVAHLSAGQHSAVPEPASYLLACVALSFATCLARRARCSATSSAGSVSARQALS